MIKVRGKNDKHLQEIIAALSEYESLHPHAQVEAYRQNAASIRIRIIDSDFSGTSKADRHDLIWAYLDKLDEDVQSEISILLLLTPDEMNDSLANFDFDHPLPSKL